ncbi:MAG TPA: M56 family metallopeptidase [Phycisphaerae bacterium]|nr:M56 family metallopeptidase [Phycisphaerae bacterium]HRY70745.1 M56 family metallopeptidase [Phycisphaerae bacterium]HSA28779.1 M56 family metallopeptidase [Phycisphaerae bacterium]
MSSTLLSFGSPSVQLGLVLAHFLWQGTAIALLLAVALWLLRRRSPNVRYTACGLAMLLMAASPVATVCYVRTHPLPASLTSEQPPLGPAPALNQTGECSPVNLDTRQTVAPAASDLRFEAAALVRTSPESDAAAVGRHATVAGQAVPSPSPDERMTPRRAEDPPAASTDPRSRLVWYGFGLQLAAMVWTLGVCAMSVRLLAGWLGLRRLYLGQSQLLPDAIDNVVCRMRQRLGLGERMEVLATRAWREPVAFGLLKPIVLLPLSLLTQYPAEVLEAMIAHELAHVRRYDLWVNVFQRVVEAVLFYHPAVWWASGRMRLERELCCDDLAIRVTGRRAEYASALVELCRTWQGSMTPALAAGMFGPRLTMMTRVRRVLHLPTSRDESSRSGFLLAGPLSVVLAGTFVLAANLRATEPGNAPTAPPASATPLVAVSATPTTSAPAGVGRTGPRNRSVSAAPTTVAKPVASRPAHLSELHTYELLWEGAPMSEALREFQQQTNMSMPNLGRILEELGVLDEPITFRSLRPLSFDEALLTVNHLIENQKLWIVRQDQYLDIRTLEDWQQHIPAHNRFASEAAFHQARLPQWDVASVMYRSSSVSPEALTALTELAAEAVPVNAAVAKVYPGSGRIQVAGIVQYVEQMLEVLRQDEGETRTSDVAVSPSLAPAGISQPLNSAGSSSQSAAPRPSILGDKSGSGRMVEEAAPENALRRRENAGPPQPLLAIRSQADGVVAEVLVKDGQKIRAGDLVARLDDEDIKLELAAAEVRLIAAEPLAKSAAERYSQGHQTEDEVRKAEAALRIAQIELKRCKLRLQRTEIRSPWDGEICGDRYTRTLGATSLLALVGTRVAAGDPVVGILMTPPRSTGTGHAADTRPATTPPSGRERTPVSPMMPGGVIGHGAETKPAARLPEHK